MEFKIVDETEIESYLTSIRALENAVSIPIEDKEDYFKVKYGDEFVPYFSEMGKTRFMLALDEEKAVGMMAGVWKSVKCQDEKATALYLADAKIDEEYKGRLLPAKMIGSALTEYPFHSDYQKWDFIVYASLEGDDGEVATSFRNLKFAKISKPTARLQIYFVAPELFLEAQGASDFSYLSNEFINLSPYHKGILSNKGKKDLILQSTQQEWGLAHIHFNWGLPLANQCHSIGEEVQQQYPGTTICFAVDSRMKKVIKWLAANKMVSKTHCDIYTFSWPVFGQKINKEAFFDLSTADI